MAALKPAPECLPEGLALVGTGDRIVKFGFVSVNVYSAAFYIDADAALKALTEYCNHSVDDLLVDPNFAPALIKANCQKAFRITFCRSLDYKKMTDSFNSCLGIRVAAGHSQATKDFVASIIPAGGVVEDNVLSIFLHGDGQTISANFQATPLSESKRLTQVESGGPGGIWEAFQGIYIDADTELPAIKTGFISGLPGLLQGKAGAGTNFNKQLSRQDEELVARAAVERTPSTRIQAQKTWAARAGRASGRDGYVFGDVTRMACRTISRRRGAPGSSGTPSFSSGDVQNEADQTRNCQDELEKQLEMLKRELEVATENAAARQFGFLCIGIFTLFFFACLLCPYSSLLILPLAAILFGASIIMSLPQNNRHVLMVNGASENIGRKALVVFDRVSEKFEPR